MIRRTRRSKRKKPKPTGRPSHITVPIDLEPGDRPENFPTLIRYLEANGKIKHTPQAQLYKARHLFIRGTPFDKICKELKVDSHILERWAVLFGWEEERDRILFQKFRKGLGIPSSRSVKDRHDRIAGTIEAALEKLLHINAMSGHDRLSPRDLSLLASTLKTTSDIRTAVRGDKVSTTEKKVDINFNMPTNVEKLAEALLSAGEAPKQIEAPKSRRIAVRIGEEVDIDDELEREVLDD